MSRMKHSASDMLCKTCFLGGNKTLSSQGNIKITDCKIIAVQLLLYTYYNIKKAVCK